MEKVWEQDLWETSRRFASKVIPSNSPTFIDVCMEKYGLDSSYYVTAAHLANDAMMKVTDVEIELITDSDMYLFFEESKRRGVSSAMKRYSEANNKYMKNYDPDKPSVFIEYVDNNGLGILAGPLPFSGFKWLMEEEINEMMGDHTSVTIFSIFFYFW